VADRYVVGSVTGWNISAYTMGEDPRYPSRPTPPSIWYVYDAPYCYAQVAEFRAKNSESLARTLAAKLNAEEAECAS
jgi:hypothetical protein